MTTPQQILPILSGDYEKDLDALRRYIAHVATFPVHIESFTPGGTSAGTAGSHAVNGVSFTHLKQESWTDLLVDVRGSAYATVAAVFSWAVTLSYNFTDTATVTAGRLSLSTLNANTHFTGPALFRGIPAGSLTGTLALSVASGTAGTNTSDYVDLVISEVIPYGLDGTQ